MADADAPRNLSHGLLAEAVDDVPAANGSPVSPGDGETSRGSEPARDDHDGRHIDSSLVPRPKNEEANEREKDNNEKDDGHDEVYADEVNNSHNPILVITEIVKETAVMPSLSTILNEDAAVKIASYLCANDVLSLHRMNRFWHDVLAKNEQSLFGNFLQRDFAEGDVLSYVAGERGLCHKRLYFAFLKKWSMPRQVGDEEPSDCITWIRPDISETKEPNAVFNNKDVSSLVFIARVGGEGYFYSSCALLQWNSDYNVKKRHQNRYGQLIIDKSWSEHTEGLLLPQNWEANQYLADYEDLEGLEVEELVGDELVYSHRLTLHVLDCKLYQVATLMDETLMENCFGEGDYLGLFYHYAKLFSCPPKGTPYFCNLSRKDLRYFQDIDDYDRWTRYPNDLDNWMMKMRTKELVWAQLMRFLWVWQNPL